MMYSFRFSLIVLLAAAACSPANVVPTPIEQDGGVPDEEKGPLNWTLRWEGIQWSCNGSVVEATRNSAQNMTLIVDDERRGAAGCVMSGTLIVPGYVRLRDLQQRVIAAVSTQVTARDGYGQLRYSATLAGVAVGSINSRIYGERSVPASSSLTALQSRFCRGTVVRLPFRVQLSATSERRDIEPRVSAVDWTFASVTRCP